VVHDNFYLILKTTFADISAAVNTRKQSAVTFKVFVLWLHNQRYYTCDVIGIYPNMKVSGPKHAVNINFTKISTKIMQTLYIPLENGP